MNTNQNKSKDSIDCEQKCSAVNKQHNSNSELQVEIEKIQIKTLEDKLKKPFLGNERYIPFKGDPKTKIKPDIYSDEHNIIGEVYTHLGKLKAAQMHKVNSDILKMLLFEKDSGVKYEKHYVVCDKATEESMRGNALIQAAIRLHGLKIDCFELDDELKQKLIKTMKRQDITKG